MVLPGVLHLRVSRLPWSPPLTARAKEDGQAALRVWLARGQHRGA